MTTPTPAQTAVLDGRYHVKRKISQGAQGVVYHALDMQTSTPVAIKYFSAKAHGYHESAARLEAEFGALAKLATVRDVVNVLAFERRAHGAYLVLEWVEAQDAAAVLREHGPLDVETWTWVARALLGALAEAHQRHVLHRDIKPQNLLLGRSLFKLIDFGIADDAGYVKLSGEAEMQGTVPYLPPEQTLGLQPTPAGDVFSAGVTLYELLTGRLPFEGEPGELQRKKLAGTFSNASALNPDVPHRLDDWFARMLAPQPELRFAGAREALAAMSTDASQYASALQSLFRACTQCGAELWRAIPYCTHCGRPYALRAAAGDTSVIVWKAASKQRLADRYQALTGRTLSKWRRSLFLAEYPRVFLHNVDAGTAQVAVAALGDHETSLTVTKTPYREVVRHLRLSNLQQGVSLAVVVSLFIFLASYTRSRSYALGIELATLLLVALAGLAWVAVGAASPLVPGKHLQGDEGGIISKPIAKARALLQRLTTPGARAKASRLVRRVHEVQYFVSRRHVAPELKQEFSQRLAVVLEHALTALRSSEERSQVLTLLRSQGARKQRAALQSLAATTRDRQELGQILSRIEALTAAEQTLATAEAEVARAESDFANVFSGVNALYLIARGGDDAALVASLTELHGGTPERLA